MPFAYELRRAYCSTKINLNFPNLVFLNPEEFRIPYLSADLRLNFVENKSFVAVFTELLNVERTNSLAIWPTPIEVRCSIDVIVLRTGECKIIGQQGLDRSPVFLLVSSVIFTDQIWLLPFKINLVQIHNERS